jgi:tRNA A-37 threonylcarbamoyl transferase component Bud32
LHGDVKHWDDDLNTLHNVLCDESEGSDKVYVVDFGLSRLDASQEELDEEYQQVKELLYGSKQVQQSAEK